jgi:23S rRNA-/tRNA-specific pseudouridylate synthase
MAKHINSIVITEIESNTRLDRYLVNSLNIPQGLVQKDLRKGLIRVNEKKISGSYRIQEEDIIQFAKEYSENKPKEKIPPNKKDLGLLKKSIIYSCDDFFYH